MYIVKMRSLTSENLEDPIRVGVPRQSFIHRILVGWSGCSDLNCINIGCGILENLELSMLSANFIYIVREWNCIFKN